MSAFSVLSDTPGETVEQIVLRVGIVPAPAFFQSIALEEERIPLQFWAATGRERARMRISRFMALVGQSRRVKLSRGSTTSALHL